MTRIDIAPIPTPPMPAPPSDVVRIGAGQIEAADHAARHCQLPVRGLLRVGTESDVGLSPAALMAVCLTENDRRFAGYDLRLLRPTTTPAMARLICWFARKRPAKFSGGAG